MDISRDYVSFNLPTPAPVQPVEKTSVDKDRQAALDAVKAIQDINLFGIDRQLRYTQDRNAQGILQITDTTTGEILLQVPSQWVLDLAESLQKAK